MVSNDHLNERRRTVVDVPISSSPAPWRTLMIAVRCNEKEGVAIADQIRAAAKHRFGTRIGVLSAVEMADISEALQDVLSLY